MQGFITCEKCKDLEKDQLNNIDVIDARYPPVFRIFDK